LFKKTGEVVEGRTEVLTVRSTNVWLERKPTPTIFIIIDDNMEALTSSKERHEHYLTASPWLTSQLKKWEQGEIVVEIANPEHPLEVITGDVALTLVIEGEKYLVSFFRDIYPIGWLIPGGCPRTKKELLNPRVLASRECAEEVLIADKEGRIYNIFQSTTELEENIRDWKLNPQEIVAITPKEIPPQRGDAQRLVIEYDGQKRFENINVTIQAEVAVAVATIYLEVTLPVKLEGLRLFDGERFPDKTLINRPIRLTNKEEKVKAIFSRGDNILSSGWCVQSAKKRMFIPKQQEGGQ